MKPVRTAKPTPTGPFSVMALLKEIDSESYDRLRVALVWRALRGLASIAPVVVVALVAGRIVDGTLTPREVWFASAVCLVSVLIAFLAHWASANQLVDVARDLTNGLRFRLVRTVRAAPVGDILRLSRGEVTSVIDRDVSDIEDFVTGSLGKFVRAVVAPPLLVLVVALLDPVLGGVLLVAGLGTAIGYRYKLDNQSRHIAHRYRSRAEQDERVVEFVQGIEVAKAFGLRSELTGQLDTSLREYKEANLRSVRSTIPLSAGLAAGASVTGGLLLAVAGWRFGEGALDQSTAAALMVLIAGAMLAFVDAGTSSSPFVYVGASLARVQGLLNVEPAPVGTGGRDAETHEVRFVGVEFGYSPGVPVLNGVEFIAPAGSVTAIVGESGAGKSTLLHLLAGLWTPDSGQVLIGGVNLSQLSPGQRERTLSIVLQDPYLPDGSIGQAIAGGRSVDDERIEAAARAARCWEFIRDRPGGLDAQVGEGGRRFSGGERQRLAIARTLVSDTPIVCMDEGAC